jgi:hypothetical protein
MEEFDNLKMKHSFMKTKLLIYQKRSKRSEAKQWELYKEQVGEIIREAFESYQKDKELYHLHLETYQRVMSPFDFGRMQAHSIFTFEFSMHGNEEQSESGKMEVDLVVALEPQPTKPEVTSDIGIFSSDVNSFGKAKGVALIPAFVPTKITSFSRWSS